MPNRSNFEPVLHGAPPLDGLDSIQMDEYNYDILVPPDDRRWAVFGVS